MTEPRPAARLSEFLAISRRAKGDERGARAIEDACEAYYADKVITGAQLGQYLLNLHLIDEAELIDGLKKRDLEIENFRKASPSERSRVVAQVIGDAARAVETLNSIVGKT
jgi:hypothetical protein